MTTLLEPVPRSLAFITVKRNLLQIGRSYGHWWVELDNDESYGWWPARSSLGLGGVIAGTSGVLNGSATAGGAPPQDPNHGLTADHAFHPVLVVPRTDDEVRSIIRRFASTFSGEWRWATRPTMNCRVFQLALFDVAGLVDGTGNYRSRGGGCPAVAPIRRITGSITGRRRWPRNLPRPGQRVLDPDASAPRQSMVHDVEVP